MLLKLGNYLKQEQLKNLELLTTFGAYRIYWTNDGEGNFFALDNNNTICSLFEFVEGDEFTQLAHMHTLEQHQGKGIGKEIMRQAVDIYSTFNLPSKDKTKTYFYIEHGLRFIRSCFKDEVLTSQQFTHPDEDDFI